MKKIWLFLIFCFAVALCLCGCGGEDAVDDSNSELNEITMVLDWTPNTNHTGLYVAQSMGWFEEEGLSVSIVQPPEDGAALMVASGRAQFGVDFQDYLAGAYGIEEPLPITAVAAMVQHNTSGIVSLKEDGIDSPAKMEGHTYATWNLPIEQAMLREVVTADGGNYDEVELIPSTVTDIVSALQADIDSVWIYYGWDGIALEQAGLETNFFYFSDIDPAFDFYSPVIIANNEFLEENPEDAEAFLRAVRRGYEYAAEHPEEAASILCEQVPELDPELIVASQTWLSAQYVADASSWGIIDAERWNAFYKWLNDNGLVECEIPMDYGFTNDYLE
ncbi:MAG: ABC transporter substrate-binding protein [Firmicutes bacterium]|nr:ABC transporter substrate-binding protein [Bacillota bacterium]